MEVAAELCIESNRAAEAFIIASTAGIDFLIKTQTNYLQKQTSELSNIILALVTRDWMDFVSRCTLDSWKEALLAALKHSDRKVSDICEKLGDRLVYESNSLQNARNAILCYICAGNVDKLVSAWYQYKKLERNDAQYKLDTVEIQELAEVIMLLSKSLQKQGISLEPNAKLADFISEYSGLLASQGALTAALSYIFELNAINNPKVDELRERLFNCVSAKNDQVQRGNNDPHINAQQKSRGSFSNQIPGYSNPIQNSFNNSWNPQSQTTVPPPALFGTTPSNQPQNPGYNMPAPLPNQPPINDSLIQPPRPSSVSSQGSLSSNIPNMQRSKYLIDPSVTSNPAPIGGGYGSGAFNPPNSMQAPNTFNAPIYNTNPMMSSVAQPSYQPQTTLMQPQMQMHSTPSGPFNPDVNSQYGQMNIGGGYMPGIPPIETAQQAMPPSYQRNPTPPPGWNDPPTVKSTRQQVSKNTIKLFIFVLPRFIIIASNVVIYQILRVSFVM